MSDIDADLYQRAVDYLVERAVTVQTAATCSLGITSCARDADEGFYPQAALTIPYHDAAGQPTGFQRVRYFDPPMIGGHQKKPLRYQQPRNTPPQIYLPPLGPMTWEQINADPAVPVIITEGEIKAACIMASTGIATKGLGGVFMFADKKLVLPDLEATVWTRRRVYVVFDSDIDSKPGVQLAEARLVEWLVKRRAHVHQVRLPPSDKGGKQGADDYIAARGPEAFKILLGQSTALSDLDLRVLEMNADVAFLQTEEKLIDLASGEVMRKDTFVSGSRFSAVKLPAEGKTREKWASVAQLWLSHPLANRYTNTIFLPGGERTVDEGDATYYNVWREQPCSPGDVTLFLDLTRYIFGETLGDDWDWPIKLLAYRAQHQTKKVPLAIMLIGEQGSGKSLWASMARAAFGRYGQSISGVDMVGGESWNSFLETSLLLTIDDVSARQMRKSIEMLRSWISEPRFKRKEKFLKDRENVSNYSLLIFTSNHRDAGAFAHDDRRFLVVGSPRREHGADWYEPMYAWLRSEKAGAHIYHYLLNYDLDGWTPPIQAPMTAEKRMAYEESLSPFERLARDMIRSDVNVVQQWLASAEQWALGVISTPGHAETPRANEILTAMQAFPIRPWYTADELCSMFPHMLAELHASTRQWSQATVPGKVSTALRNNGIYFLRNVDNADGFTWRGRLQQFLIVCPSAPYPREMTQAQFEKAMGEMRNYTPTMRMNRA